MLGIPAKLCRKDPLTSACLKNDLIFLYGGSRDYLGKNSPVSKHMLTKGPCDFVSWQLFSYEKVHSCLSNYFFDYSLGYELGRIPQPNSSLKIRKVFKLLLVSFLNYRHHIGLTDTRDKLQCMYPWSYRLRHVDVIYKALFVGNHYFFYYVWQLVLCCL